MLARTPHRCAAGELEVALKEAFTDRTHWQKMLKNEVLENPHWGYAMDQAFSAVPWSHEDFIVDDEEVVVLEYPVQQYPEKIKSLSFDKVDTVEGTLLGIKGQYLLFDDNRVLNIRKHNGYHLRFEA